MFWKKEKSKVELFVEDCIQALNSGKVIARQEDHSIETGYNIILFSGIKVGLGRFWNDPFDWSYTLYLDGEKYPCNKKILYKLEKAIDYSKSKDTKEGVTSKLSEHFS